MGMCFKVRGIEYTERDIVEYLECTIHECSDEMIEIYHEIKAYGIHNVNINDVRNIVFQMFNEGF